MKNRLDLVVYVKLPERLQVAASCCTMQHMNKTLSSPSKPSRVSVPVSAEVLLIFERLAKAANMSTGRAIAEWLADTVEAAELMASTVERARAAPKIVTAELHAMMLGMADQTKELSDRYAKFKGSLPDTSATRSGAVSAAPTAEPIPPSCNTGGKVPKTTLKPKGPKFPLPPAKVQAYADNNGFKPVSKK
jgi:hypothetical protein